MDQRRFGRTGLQISEFTLGGGIVGGILIHPTEDIRFAALERVVAAGCNWIDTASSYGDGESELALGRLLSGLETRPHLSTKVRLDNTDISDLKGQIRQSLEASLTRLQTDRVDLLQLHNTIGPKTDGRLLSAHKVLRPGGVADIFDELRQENYFDFHGVTALGETASIIEVLDSGRFDTAQVYYNMLNPSAAQPLLAAWGGQDFGGIVEACRSHDMGIMNIRVLAAGVLATDERHGRELVVTSGTDISDEQKRTHKLFGLLGDRLGTRAQTAVRFALANPDLATIVTGVATLDQLDEALAAFEMGPIPAGTLAEIEACYAAGLGG